MSFNLRSRSLLDLKDFFSLRDIRFLLDLAAERQNIALIF